MASLSGYTKISMSNFQRMINFQKILKFTPEKWGQLARYGIMLIRSDMERGHLQGEREVDFYRSQQYVKYKKNGMRRFTFDQKGKKIKGSKLKYKYEKFYTGESVEKFAIGVSDANKRIKPYYASKIVSTLEKDSKVDLTLTGHLKTGLHVTDATHWGATIAADPEDGDKIRGNRRYGREILTLHEGNIRQLKNQFIKSMIDKNLKDWAREKIVITIG